MNEAPTFTSLSGQWLEECRGLIAPETIDLYRYLLDTHIIPFFGDDTEIAEGRVKQFISEKKAAGISDSTLGTLIRILRRVLEYGASLRKCPLPRWDIDLGTVQNKHETVILTQAEERQLTAYLIENPSPKHLCMFLILTCGISVGESLELQWKDISVKGRKMTVRTKRGPLVRRKQRVRTLSLGERELLYLRKMQSLPDNYLCSGTPEPIDRTSLRNRWHLVVRDQLLPPMSLTCLRHTYAVHAIEAGMDYATLSSQLGLDNTGTFRDFYKALVSEEERERLDRERLESRKVRQNPTFEYHHGPETDPEVAALRKKVEEQKKVLNDTLANLEFDLDIINTLRNSDCVQGKAREGLYKFVEKVLGPDDKDGQYLVEYMRYNMRVATMPLRVNNVTTVQAIRSRVAHGFEKLCKRLDDINAVEGWDILGMFRELCEQIEEAAPPAPKRTGPKPKPSVEKDYQKALAALQRIKEAR